MSYGGHTTAPIAYGDTVTITGYGGGGGGAFPLTNDWVYLGDTSATFHLYTPPNVFDESAAEPWTLQQATQEWLQAEYRAWLAAERQWINGWLRAERDWAAAEHYRQRAAVKERAEALLISLLPESEKQRYRHEGYFEVIGSHGGHYQIHRGVAGNITWMHPDGRRGSDLCCHPDTFDGVGQLPTEDVMLAQLLALRADEAAFVRVGNVHSGLRQTARTQSGNTRCEVGPDVVVCQYLPELHFRYFIRLAELRLSQPPDQVHRVPTGGHHFQEFGKSSAATYLRTFCALPPHNGKSTSARPSASSDNDRNEKMRKAIIAATFGGRLTAGVIVVSTPVAHADCPHYPPSEAVAACWCDQAAQGINYQTCIQSQIGIMQQEQETCMRSYGIPDCIDHRPPAPTTQAPARTPVQTPKVNPPTVPVQAPVTKPAVVAPPKGLDAPPQAIAAARAAPATRIHPANPPPPPTQVDFNQRVQSVITTHNANIDVVNGLAHPRHWDYIDDDTDHHPVFYNPMSEAMTFRYFYSGDYREVYVAAGSSVVLDVGVDGMFPFTAVGDDYLASGSFDGGVATGAVSRCRCLCPGLQPDGPSRQGAAGGPRRQSTCGQSGHLHAR